MSTTTENKGMAERSMGFGLRALNRLAGSDLLDRIRIRKQVEKAALPGHQERLPHARPPPAAPSRPRRSWANRPARRRASRRASSTSPPTTSSRCSRRRAAPSPRRRSARPRSRPTPTRETPQELLAQANELGVNMLGVPEELGGVMHEQAAVTSVLIGEALAHGDMGIAYAALAPGAVATAIGLWGSAEQEATYLPAFTGEDVPAAALAILEPRPLFDPLELETKARRDGDDWVLDGAKSLVARATECELFVVAADAEGIGPALFVVESGAKGLSVEDEPAMGLRPAATGRLLLDERPAARPSAAARRGRAPRTTPSASTARGSPGARSRSAPRRRSSTT